MIKAPIWELYLQLKNVLGMDGRFDSSLKKYRERISGNWTNKADDPLKEGNRKGGKSTTLQSTTIGWEPTCKCLSDDTDQHGSCIRFNPIPCTVYDPFMGSGTVGLVAYKLNRYYVGTELNPEYIKMAEKRLQKEKDKYGLLE